MTIIIMLLAGLEIRRILKGRIVPVETFEPGVDEGVVVADCSANSVESGER